MHKNEFLIKSIPSLAYLNKNWMIALLSITYEDKDAYKKDPYPYRIVRDSFGVYFIDPEASTGGEFKLTPIEGFEKTEPVFKFSDRILMPAGIIANLNIDTETTVGNAMFNLLCLVQSFGDKIPYQNKKISVSSLENYIAERLCDNPKTESERTKDKLYVDEYLKFVNAVFYLTNFTQLCVWAATEKVLTAPPGIAEFKQKLLEEYKDRLNDSVALAEIDKKLIAFDAEYLKGDPGENFLLSAKSRNIVRKRKYLMYGAEQGLEESVSLTPITRSLEEGWDMSKFPDMNNTLRAGSFNRGAETQLGGESVKWLLRASSNIVVTVDDCGSRFGKTIQVNSLNSNKLVGFNIITDDGITPVDTQEETGTYLGKTVMIRSPMYCLLDKTDYCKACVGKKLASNPKGLSMTISEYGSAFLLLFMKAMHGKQLNLVKLDYKSSLS